MKYEIADELGLMDKVKAVGWPYLTAKEAGRIGGILTARNKKRKKLDEDFAAQNADLIKAYMDSEEN
ncbi:MAG: alpha/beta-type small acid-soluble spore protein [Clostridioides sp.]|nr:alpha/beta-type small acid-soluble spore protein [Clostridioides sp.]